MSRFDDVLAAIDAGLQSSDEPSYGNELPGGSPNCVRCHADLDVAKGDVCSSCRAFLLGDTTTDPAAAFGGWADVEGSFAQRAMEIGARAAALIQSLADAHQALHGTHVDDAGWECPVCALIALNVAAMVEDDDVASM